MIFFYYFYILLLLDFGTCNLIDAKARTPTESIRHAWTVAHARNGVRGAEGDDGWSKIVESLKTRS